MIDAAKRYPAHFGIWAACALLTSLGCQSEMAHRNQADDVAYNLVAGQQAQGLGQSEPFTVDTPANTLRRRLVREQKLKTVGPSSVGSELLTSPGHWPEPGVPARAPDQPPVVAPWAEDAPVKLTLVQALQVAARNNRSYQARKEVVYVAALSLDAQLDQFRNTYTGLVATLLTSDHTGGVAVNGFDASATAVWSRRLASGATLSARMILDTTKLLSSDGSSSAAIFYDGSITLPLLRGAGSHIVTEPLTQAQRDLLYAIWSLERFKRTFAVNVAERYLGVLQTRDQLVNSTNSYRNLIQSARQAEALHRAGRLSQVQRDQSLQSELNARANWIQSGQGYQQALDEYKIVLGLPADANIELDRAELDRLGESSSKRLAGTPKPNAAVGPEVKVDDPVTLRPPSRQGAGPYELKESNAIDVAFVNRLDLKTSKDRVEDAQRDVIITADALKAGLDLVVSGSFGEQRSVSTAGSDDNFSPDAGNGTYSLGADIDLPWERTSQRNDYRQSYLALEASVRTVQDLEDQIKLDIRNGLRSLELTRENYSIQSQAVKLASHRVESSRLFLSAGRAQIRDLLDAEEALLRAQNSLTRSVVNYRISELKLQRDMGVLKVDEKGLWREYEAKP
jgi:outer membrane protein TolC